MQSKHQWRVPNWLLVALGLAISLALLAIPQAYTAAQSGDDGDGGGQPVRTPDDCAKCHSDQYGVWAASPHAGALHDPVFIEGWNRAGSPGYCQSCHATGYDAESGQVAYEGVGCAACHTDAEGKHPQSQMTVDKSSELCASCHSGPHAPAYNQWLSSDHAATDIGCSDCHQSHDSTLRLGSTTELCTSCHKNHDQNLHGAQDMACEDCHMAPGDTVVDPLSGQTNGAGHTFDIPANVCAKCHGMTHTLAPDGTVVNASSVSQPAAAEAAPDSSQPVNLALTAGGIGGLVIGFGVPLLLTRRGGKHESSN